MQQHITAIALVTLITLPLIAEPTFTPAPASMGLDLSAASAAWADIDNDGYADLLAGPTLWKNHEGKRFTKLGDYGPGVFGDFDNDGRTDIFAWPNRLYRNDVEKGFVPVELPEMTTGSSRHATFGDLNNDALLDIYIGGYENWDKQLTFPDHLLTNRDGRTFELTFSDDRYRARGVTACDFDRDGDLDIYISNYRLQPNVLWCNNGKGNLTDRAAEYNVVATTAPFNGGHAIGAAWGDINNDGHIDLFAGNFAHVDNRGDQPKSRFLENLGSQHDHHFRDRGPCGVFYQESYASPSLADFDNDGDLDLVFTTVYATASFGRKNHPVLFENKGKWRFRDLTAPHGLAQLPATYQAAWADFDNDGDLDLVTAGKLFINAGNDNHYLKVKLTGDGKKVNRSALGAQVRIKMPGRTLTRHVEGSTGECNQNDLTLHFGLSKHTAPVDLEIFWPTGLTQTVKNVKPNRLIEIKLSPN